MNTPDFDPANFWEALYGKNLDESELAEIHANATAFVKLMMQEELLEKRRKLQVDTFIIDRKFEDLEKNIFLHHDIKTLRQKFESAMASAQIKNQK